MIPLTFRQCQVLLLLSIAPQTRTDLQVRFQERYHEPITGTHLGNLLGHLRALELAQSENIAGHHVAYGLTLLGEDALSEAFTTVYRKDADARVGLPLSRPA